MLALNKKLVLAFLLIMVMTIISACQQEDATSNKDAVIQEDVTETEGKDPLLEGKVPTSDEPHAFAGFTKDQIFAGGVEVTNYALEGIRRLPHPEFTRLSFDFKGSEEGAQNIPPQYEVSYDDDKKELTAVFKGVNENLIETKTEEIKSLAPIISNIEFVMIDQDLHAILLLKTEISFQVFHLADPARIAIVLKPDAELEYQQ